MDVSVTLIPVQSSSVRLTHVANCHVLTWQNVNSKKEWGWEQLTLTELVDVQFFFPDKKLFFPHFFCCALKASLDYKTSVVIFFVLFFLFSFVTYSTCLPFANGFV